VGRALQEAGERGITGKAITLFRLERVNELTGGDTLAANSQLGLNKARLAARIAVELAALGRLN
jgi:pseudouridylate synthase